MASASSYALSSGFAALLADLGLDATVVVRRAGLPGDLLARGATALPPERYYALWRALEEEVGDPALPVHIGQAISVEVFEPSLFAALCSPDLNVAATRLARYKPLIGPLRLLVARSETETTLDYLWPEDETPPDVLTLTELVFWVAFARLATRTQVQPLRVGCPSPPPERVEEVYREYFGVEVGESARHSVTFSAADAARPFLTADEAMWEFFEPELRRRLSQLDAGTSMSERVRGALLELLPAGEASMDAVSRKLMVSQRTLQRRLGEEGTSFQVCLAGTRETLARHYLSSSRLTAGEIAFLLGYDDANSFYRAFRGWTGETPERVRMAAT